MSLFGVCMTFNIYYLLLRLSNVIFIQEMTPAEEHKFNLTSHLLCPNFNCKSKECSLDNSIGARVCSGVCTDGWRGSTCQNLCPRNCIRCNKYSGVCSKCMEPWSGLKCTFLVVKKGDDSGEAKVKVLHGRRLHNSQRHCLDDHCVFCKEGWFGEDCSGECPNNCYAGCHKAEGYCDHSCKQSFYGRLCSESCSPHCREGCNQTTAYCFGGCARGVFGPQCTQTCITTCDNGVCDRRSGKCTETTTETSHMKEECPKGFYGPYCEDKLPSIPLYIFIGVIIGLVLAVLLYVCVKRRVVSYMRYLNIDMTEMSSDSENDDLCMSLRVVTEKGKRLTIRSRTLGITKKRQPKILTA
ncbi:multiple epidermal growth factor-like domains protein 10 [Haliotis rufescens]|uniref:multiple epidermal growth factor-like domains protein 10 n=1 Tax=Haliotis rufescens TaxID=6454 RepID=UPI00201EC3C8|nr:multiple epidermal growth factor-like domains protein 10 [Haliotis rufescens]XP_048247958.1 multiple epidermal growth factor-like domains protein 10 [Haliotis rufescens]